MARWYEVAGAVVIAAATTAAGVASAQSATSVHVGPPAPAVHAAGVPAGATDLPPVTSHPLASVPPPVHGSGSAVQVIQVQILGGSLSLVPESVAIELEPSADGDVWTGALPPVRVIDARGTHEGWRVRWSVSSVDASAGSGPRVPSGLVRLAAGEPVVVAGVPDGLRSGNGHLLFSANPGAGAGTYEAGGTVTLRPPRPWAPESVVVHLTFELG